MQDIFNNLNQELANLSIYKPVTNPYVENLIEMGYDRADCETVAVAGLDKTFPMNIHGRVYQTQEEYDSALHDFLNGMWNIPSLSECSGAPIFFVIHQHQHHVHNFIL